MNDLYIHQLETENKQLREALQKCRKALEEEIATKNEAIMYIKTEYDSLTDDTELLEILGDKENE